MELTEWAVERGARNVVLCSRSGVKTGYHKYRLNVWRDQGIDVEVSTYDLTTSAGAKDTVKLAQSLAPLGGIFNLAGVRVTLLSSFCDNGIYLGGRGFYL